MSTHIDAGYLRKSCRRRRAGRTRLDALRWERRGSKPFLSPQGSNHAANFKHLHGLTGSNIAFVILKIHHRWAGTALDLSPNGWAS
jgi:hypothetical protein